MSFRPLNQRSSESGSAEKDPSWLKLLLSALSISPAVSHSRPSIWTWSCHGCRLIRTNRSRCNSPLQADLVGMKTSSNFYFSSWFPWKVVWLRSAAFHPSPPSATYCFTSPLYGREMFVSPPSCSAEGRAGMVVVVAVVVVGGGGHVPACHTSLG